jgi:hypothetical protein
MHSIAPEQPAVVEVPQQVVEARPRVERREPIVLGSVEHRDLLVREFVETHVPFDPATIEWPEIDGASIARLRSLPVWDEAVRTEHATAKLVCAYAAREDDPELRYVIALQGYEESRHSALIDAMLRRYSIFDVPADRPENPQSNLGAFLRMGYGECMDSFFAFGLFEVARRSGLFPLPLVELFEPLVQEEARHILFFVNWLVLQRARRGFLARSWFGLRCATSLARQLVMRVRGALGLEQAHFTTGHEAIDLDIRPGEFLDLCQAEHERRLSLYDPRLARPRLVPAVARQVRRLFA